MYYGGNGRIRGTTKVSDSPNYSVMSRVRLIHQLSGVCIDEQWSNPITGAYDFTGYDPTQIFTVLAYDTNGVFRAVVANNAPTEVWP